VWVSRVRCPAQLAIELRLGSSNNDGRQHSYDAIAVAAQKARGRISKQRVFATGRLRVQRAGKAR
jgi:hypothetical protein